MKLAHLLVGKFLLICNREPEHYLLHPQAIWTIDPEILKDVLITKFNSFRARDVTIYPEEYTTLDLAG